MSSPWRTVMLSRDEVIFFKLVWRANNERNNILLNYLDHCKAWDWFWGEMK